MKTIEDIKNDLRNGGSVDTAIDNLTLIIEANETNEQAYIERGLLNWSRGERALAINDYHKALVINPEGKAKLALKATYEILDYYNKDLYNP